MMMEKQKRVEILRNILVLVALVGLVLLSWLLGHILRYSIPTLWHPPLPEMDPQIKYGFEFEGIRRSVVLPGLAPGNIAVQFQIRETQVMLPEECPGYTYYTSLPAKCRTVDGRLIQVGGIESNVILIPQGK
jgi:hypothetical protein